MAKEDYKKITDEVFALFESFSSSGFSEEQAFELTNGYIQSYWFNEAIRNSSKEMEYRNKEILRRIRK